MGPLAVYSSAEWFSRTEWWDEKDSSFDSASIPTPHATIGWILANACGLELAVDIWAVSPTPPKHEHPTNSMDETLCSSGWKWIEFPHFSLGIKILWNEGFVDLLGASGWFSVNCEPVPFFLA